MVSDIQKPLQPTFRARAGEAITAAEAATTAAEITAAAGTMAAKRITGVTEQTAPMITSGPLSPPVAEGRATEEGAAVEEDQATTPITPTLIPTAVRMTTMPLAPRTNTHRDPMREAKCGSTTHFARWCDDSGPVKVKDERARPAKNGNERVGKPKDKPHVNAVRAQELSDSSLTDSDDEC